LRVEAVQPGIAHRLPGGAQGEEDVPLELTRLLRGRDLRRVEVLDLGRDPDRRVTGVERTDPVDAALARDGRAPGRAHVGAERRDLTEPCNPVPSHLMCIDTRYWYDVTNQCLRVT